MPKIHQHKLLLPQMQPYSTAQSLGYLKQVLLHFVSFRFYEDLLCTRMYFQKECFVDFFSFYKYMWWLTSITVESVILVSAMNIIIDHMEVFSKC